MLLGPNPLATAFLLKWPTLMPAQKVKPAPLNYLSARFAVTWERSLRIPFVSRS